MARRRHKPALSQEDPAGEERVVTDEEVRLFLDAGSTGAAEIVYDRVANAVDAVLFRLLGPNDHEHDDLAQQAMEQIICTVVSGRYLRHCSLSSWATLITLHLAIDTKRFRSRDGRVFDRHVGSRMVELAPDDNRSTEQIVETQRRANRFFGVLSSIPMAHAEAVVLHDLFGHDLAEIARLTGVSVAAAQSRLVRGRRKALRLLTVAERRARKS